MTEETSRQRIDRLVRKKNIPALLLEAQQLLTIYLHGDDDIDLEPIVSAQSILQQTTDLFSPQDQWHQEFPITSVTRADLVSAGFSQEQVASLSDEDMRTIAAKMEDLYCDHGYWDDIVTAVEYVLERKKKE